MSEPNTDPILSRGHSPLLEELVDQLAGALDASCVFVVQSLPVGERARMIASHPRDAVPDTEFACSWMAHDRPGTLRHFQASGAKERFGGDYLISRFEADRFACEAILAPDGDLVGWVGAMDWRADFPRRSLDECLWLLADVSRLEMSERGGSLPPPDFLFTGMHQEDRLAVDAAYDGFWDWDLERGTVAYSRRWLGQLGEWQEAPPSHPGFWLGRIHADDRVPVLLDLLATLAGRRAQLAREHRVRHADGCYRLVIVRGATQRSATGRPLRFAGWLADITRRRELEAEVRQSRKMESVGQLAAGVAHDFNNLLLVIRNHAELALGVLADESLARDDLEVIGRAAQRAAALTAQLLDLCRREDGPRADLDLNEVIVDAEHMIRSLLGAPLRLRVNLAPNLWRIRGDAAQVERVITNLVLNARDAMPEGGVLSIESGNVTTDAPGARDRGAGPGEHVLLRVGDTGHGMSDETRRRLFEPFYTTKPPGKGTGLGLITVNDVVRKMGGFVEVESEAGRGTTFSIFWPRLMGSTEECGAPT